VALGVGADEVDVVVVFDLPFAVDVAVALDVVVVVELVDVDFALPVFVAVSVALLVVVALLVAVAVDDVVVIADEVEELKEARGLKTTGPWLMKTGSYDDVVSKWAVRGGGRPWAPQSAEAISRSGVGRLGCFRLWSVRHGLVHVKCVRISGAYPAVAIVGWVRHDGLWIHVSERARSEGHPSNGQSAPEYHLRLPTM
jgi:hypothetical protein